MKRHVKVLLKRAICLADILDKSESNAGRDIIERKQTLVFDVRETGRTEDNDKNVPDNIREIQEKNQAIEIVNFLEQANHA